MTIKVIYILGAGSSGSTLLSLLLGAHSRMVNVGEISHIDRYRALDLNCGCGERVSKCSFWSKVFSTKDTQIRDKDGKLTTFNSMIDALNFMSKTGYDFVSAYTITISNQNVYHYLLQKKEM